MQLVNCLFAFLEYSAWHNACTALICIERTNEIEEAMINSVNASTSQLYKILRTQTAQTQNIPPLEEYAVKDSEVVKNAVVLSSQIGKPVKITGEAMYPLLKAQEASTSAQRPGTARWQTIANKYDVTSISTKERAAMTQELLDNQFISNDVGLTMMAPLSINENIYQKVDYLSIARNSYEFLSNRGGDPKQLELLKQSLETLEHLNVLSSKTNA